VHRHGSHLRLPIIFSFLFAVAPVFGQGISDSVRNLNGRVLQLQEALQRANPAEKAAIQAEAAPVFRQRASALSTLIRQDPASALALAFSQDLLDTLAANFPASTGNLERQGEWSGTSNHLVFDDPDR